MKARPRYFDGSFSRGLRTTPHGRSAEPDDYAVFQDAEVDRGGCEIRGGMVRVGRITNTTGQLDFNGSDVFVTIPSAAGLSSLAILQWTLELIFQADTLAADRFILGRAAASAVGVSIKQTTTSTVVIVITDSAAATLTLTFTGVAAGTICLLAIVRDGANVTAWLNGSTQTGTMHATLGLPASVHVVGKDDAGGFLDGGVDRMTLWAEARTNRNGLAMRVMNTRNPKIIFNYVFDRGAADDVIDSGRAGVHAVPSGTLAWTRTPLALNPAPIQALGYNVRKSGAREVVAVSYGRFHTATVQ